MAVYMHVSTWKYSRAPHLILRLNLLRNGAMCRARILYTIWVRGLYLILTSSRSSFGTRVQRGFHLFDKMLVPTASLVGRKERMWQRRESGRLLILSTTMSLSLDSFAFLRFDCDRVTEPAINAPQQGCWVVCIFIFPRVAHIYFFFDIKIVGI